MYLRAADKQMREILKGAGFSVLLILPFYLITIPYLFERAEKLGIDIIPKWYKKRFERRSKQVRIELSEINLAENVVIVDSVRTGLAKSFRGTFNMTRGDDMITHLIDAMLDRNPNLPADAVEDVIMGCGNPEGATGHNIGRNAVVLSKLPLTVGETSK